MHIDQLGGSMTKKTRARFTPEFRLESAQLVTDQNYRFEKQLKRWALVSVTGSRFWYI
jgi:transposase-like protein